MSKTVEEIINEHKNRVAFEACKPDEYQSLIEDLNQLLIEAKIKTYKDVAIKFVGIPTKTLKREDLKEYLVYSIGELQSTLKEGK